MTYSPDSVANIDPRHSAPRGGKAPAPGRSVARTAVTLPRPLFVAGAPRSGTSALVNYLNIHPEILVCRERYKHVAPKRIVPELFAFERILDFRVGETNQSPDWHARLLEKKDHARLKWIGDKYPHYVRSLETLAVNNPGAQFIITYRSAADVAKSFEARARNPEDRWPAENGFEAGVRMWNLALQCTRDFVTSSRSRVLVIDYDSFFSSPTELLPSISEFLKVEIDDRVHAVWRRMAANFAARRRPKAPLSPEQARLVANLKDEAAERWVADYIEHQAENRFVGRSSPWSRVRGALQGRRLSGLRRR